MIAERLRDLRTRMQAKELDAILITNPFNRFYLSGYTAEDAPPNESSGCLLITKNAAYLVTSGTNENQARAQATDFEVVRRKGDASEALKPLLGRHRVRRLGFEQEAIVVAAFQRLEKTLDGKVELVPVGELASELRLVKSAAELAQIERAVAITDDAFEAVLRAIGPDWTERQMAWALDDAMRRGGADAIGFGTIVAAGPNGAFAHHDAGDRQLGEGIPIVIDMGARVGGYNADLTRSIILGEPTDRSREIYNTVLAALEAAEAGVRAGITGKEADALARDVITAAGFGDYFGHGLGHGVGVQVHEAPGAGPQFDTPLTAGSTLTIEPGIYIPDWGGVRIEDLVVINTDGVRVLSKAAKQVV
ncbi:MAG: Xaa-Pro peptidase family protein [Thermomicrobiales bacterium]